MKPKFLIHKKSGIEFEFIKEFKLQFSNIYFVRLKNLKTGKFENFIKDEYLKHFYLKKE